MEVHISNIHARDELHRHSKSVRGREAVIAGLGPTAAIVAMRAALQTRRQAAETPAAAHRAGEMVISCAGIWEVSHTGPGFIAIWSDLAAKD